ncbi:MAG: hypothetical protein OIF47_17040 [Marinibacterium sp.]|nr:hypothetical protein [Marinibacterium sp.]
MVQNPTRFADRRGALRSSIWPCLVAAGRAGLVVATLGCGLSFGLSAPSHALSPSEQAAQSERPATQAERRVHKTECAFSVKGGKRTTIARSVSAQITTLPEMRLLKLLDVQTQPGGKASVRKYKDLPNGGIAGKDFCGPVQIANLTPNPRVGDVSNILALRLRPGLDLRRDYPTTSRAIFRNDQLLTLPAGRYAVFDISTKRVESWYATHGKAWASQTAKKPVGVTIGNHLAIRISQ